MFIIKYYVLYLIVCALLLYEWQCSRFVYTNIATNVINALCYGITVPTISLGDRNSSAPLYVGLLPYMWLVNRNVMWHMTICYF